VRLAIGATRARLLRQLLIESVMLSMMGGLLGVLLAQWGAMSILRLAAQGPNLVPIDFRLDLRILGFTAAVSLLTGIMSGLAPALRATHVNPNPAVVEELIRGTQGARLSKALVIAQVGLSLLLLVGAGLFVRTLQNLKGLDPGFNRQNLVIFSVNPVLVGYPRDRAARFSAELLQRVEGIPSVRSASLSLFGLLEGNGWTTLAIVPGFSPSSEEDEDVELNLVGPKFFETVGMTIVKGRSFEARDQQNSLKIVLINETMARQYFGSENPIGRRITVNGVESEVVGLVKDAKSYSLRDRPTRKAYVPFPTEVPFSGQTSFTVRADGDPASLVASIRQEARTLDPSVPLYGIRTMTEQIERSLSQERLIATLATFSGLLALLLVCVGLYGVISYRVVRRTGEIGIRMALGAQQSDVLWMVTRETLSLILIGVAIGLPVALAATRLITSLLFGLSPTDPFTISSATFLLTVVCAFAGYLPARRASRVDPMAALRYE
jgi:predicted permease